MESAPKNIYYTKYCISTSRRNSPDYEFIIRTNLRNSRIFSGPDNVSIMWGGEFEFLFVFFTVEKDYSYLSSKIGSTLNRRKKYLNL